MERRERAADRAEVNRHVRTAVKRFDAAGRAKDEWAFLCECGTDGCDKWVTLTLSEYETLRDADEPIVAPGHEIEPGKKARRKARKLAEEAKALRAQADVQKKRAARNLDA